MTHQRLRKYGLLKTIWMMSAMNENYEIWIMFDEVWKKIHEMVIAQIFDKGYKTKKSLNTFIAAWRPQWASDGVTCGWGWSDHAKAFRAFVDGDDESSLQVFTRRIVGQAELVETESEKRKIEGRANGHVDQQTLTQELFFSYHLPRVFHPAFIHTYTWTWTQ